MEVFKFLESIGCNDYTVMNDFEDIVFTSNMWEVADWGWQISKLLPTADYQSYSNLDFSVNSRLQGDVTPCYELDCRLKSINEMKRFASLYAEKVVFANVFEKYTLEEGDVEETEELKKKIRTDFYYDIVILYSVKELIEYGIIVFSSSKYHMCKDCYADFVGEFGNGNKFNDLKKSIVEDYANNIEVKFVQDSIMPSLEITGSENYVHHGTSILTMENRWYSDNNLLRAKSRILNKSEMLNYGIVDVLVEDVIDEIFYQNYITYNYNLNFLSDSYKNMKYIKKNVNSQIDEKQLMFDCLAHELPVFENVSVDSVLELRDSDSEAFRVYRDSMNELAGSIKGISDEKVLREAFNDLIQKELNSIEFKISRNKKKLQRNAKEAIFVGTGTLAIGAVNGIISKDFLSILETVGGFKALYELIKTGIDYFDEKSMISDERLYFLWKIKKGAYFA